MNCISKRSCRYISSYRNNNPYKISEVERSTNSDEGMEIDGHYVAVYRVPRRQLT
jgi:hypothetical protein